MADLFTAGRARKGPAPVRSAILSLSVVLTISADQPRDSRVRDQRGGGQDGHRLDTLDLHPAVTGRAIGLCYPMKLYIHVGQTLERLQAICKSPPAIRSP